MKIYIKDKDEETVRQIIKFFAEIEKADFVFDGEGYLTIRIAEKKISY